MLKLKLQYFGHLMWRVDWLEGALMLEGIGGRRRRGRQDEDAWMASLIWWTWVWVNIWSWWWTGRSGVLQFMGSQRVGHDWATELNWICFLKKPFFSKHSEIITFCHHRSFPASGSFQMSQLFTSGGQSIEVSASASVLPMNIQDWSSLGLTGLIALQSKGLSRVFSNTTV